jgi:tryptophan synthase alpha subunit
MSEARRRPPRDLEAALRSPGTRAQAARPYITAARARTGRGPSAVAAAGADAVEIGIPSPTGDGRPVIQEASAAALAAGATRASILDQLAASTSRPDRAMTTTTSFPGGELRFARSWRRRV